MEDAAGTVPGQVNLLRLARCGQCPEEFLQHRLAGTSRVEGPSRTFFHLPPDGTARGSRGVFDEPVRPVEKTACAAFNLLARAEDHVLDLFEQARVVHEVVGIDPVRLERVLHRGDAPCRSLDVVEAAVRPEQQVFVVVAVGDEMSGFPDVLDRAPVAAVRVVIAVVDVHEVARDLRARRRLLEQPLGPAGIRAAFGGQVPDLRRGQG